MTYKLIPIRNLNDATTAVTQAETYAQQAEQYAKTAGTQVDSNVAGFIESSSSATYTALQPALGRVRFTNLPTSGIVSAHRCGGARDECPWGPEESLEAAMAAIAAGANVIDIDLQHTADGAIILNHDSTWGATTTGSGNISDTPVTSIPLMNQAYAGTGWGTPRVLTLQEFLAQINGRAVVTIEAKSSSDVTKIANIVKRMGLQESCMINTSDPAVVPSIVNTGMYAHVWCWDDVSKIPTAIANGAHFIEVPYNASASIVSECQAAVNDSSKNLAYFVAGPISTRAERDAITPGIMGHVTDALGMTNRAGSTRLLKTIAPSLAAGKRGVGWRVYKGAYDNLRGLTDSGDKTLTINPGGIIVSGNASYSHCNLYLGDLSGTPSTSYTVKLKFIPAAGMAGTGARIGLRVASEDADKSGTDVDTRGYEVALRGNGQLVAWSCPGGAVGTPLGTFPTGAALTSGATYEVDVAITASTVTVKRVGTGDSISASNTDHRGGNIYLTTDSYSDGNCDGSQIVGIEIS